MIEVAYLRDEIVAAAPSEIPRLIGILHEAIALAQQRMNQQPEPPKSDLPRELVSAAEMAALIDVPESWIRKQAREGHLPCVRVGRYTRFKPADVIARLQEDYTG